MSSKSFHIHLYGPQESDQKPIAERTPAIPTSFEAAQQRLSDALPDVLLEPDGSFAWAGPTFQIVGMIYDAADQIQYVELRGHCDPAHLRQLIEILSGMSNIDQFLVMVLPERQWKNFQSFEKSDFGM